MLTWKTLLFLPGRSLGAAELDRVLLLLRRLILPRVAERGRGEEGELGGMQVRIHRLGRGRPGERGSLPPLPDPPPVTPPGGLARGFLSSGLSSAPRWLGEGVPGGACWARLKPAGGGRSPPVPGFVPPPGETWRKGQRGHLGAHRERGKPSLPSAEHGGGCASPGHRSPAAPGSRPRGPSPLPPRFGKVPRQGACALPLHLIMFNERGLLCTEASCGRLL